MLRRSSPAAHRSAARNSRLNIFCMLHALYFSDGLSCPAPGACLLPCCPGTAPAVGQCNRNTTLTGSTCIPHTPRQPGKLTKACSSCPSPTAHRAALGSCHCGRKLQFKLEPGLERKQLFQPVGRTPDLTTFNHHACATLRIQVGPRFACRLSSSLTSPSLMMNVPNLLLCQHQPSNTCLETLRRSSPLQQPPTRASSKNSLVLLQHPCFKNPVTPVDDTTSQHIIRRPVCSLQHLTPPSSGGFACTAPCPVVNHGAIHTTGSTHGPMQGNSYLLTSCPCSPAASPWQGQACAQVPAHLHLLLFTCALPCGLRPEGPCGYGCSGASPPPAYGSMARGT
jgi:hypothetical protein